MAPRSDRVEGAGITAIQRDRDPSEITSETFFSESDQLRSLFAQLINAETSRIALIPSVSYGIATIAKNLSVESHQNIVLMHEQFPSNVYGWRRVREHTGCEIRTVEPPLDAQDRGKLWNERILEAIDPDTALVTLGHVHWADGTRFDLEAIGRRARDVGAALVVDGTQSVGALPFDTQRIQPDAVVCAGYKWLLGPYSLGLAYYGPRFDHGIPLEESWVTRYNSQNLSGLGEYEDRYQPGAIRFDMGERSNFILVPMLIAAIEHLLEWEVERIQEYCAHLTHDLIHEAVQLGFSVEEEPWRGAHLFGLRPGNAVSIESLQQILKDRKISVSIRGDAVRVSPHVYNDAADTSALLEALETATRRSTGGVASLR